MMPVPVVSSEALIDAAAAQKHIPVGEDLQQRQQFSGDQGIQAQDITKLLAPTGQGAPGTGQAAEEGLAVQVKVIQAGAAVWLPAQQSCSWPVNVMLEVSVRSDEALPGGADITVFADAVSEAQRVVLAHGGPLPVRLQRALAPSAQRAAKATTTTAFGVPQGRRVAHVDVPKAGVWYQEHFMFPVLTFQKHSDLHPMSLMFAAAAAPSGGGTSNAGASSVATTMLLPRTVSMRNSDEVSAALRVLRLPGDIFDRICVPRGRNLIYKRGPVAPPPAVEPTGPPTLRPATVKHAEHAPEGSREKSPGLQDPDLPEGTTRSASPRSVGTDCERWVTTHGHDTELVAGLPRPVDSPDTYACPTEIGSSLRCQRSASPGCPVALERERHRGRKHMRLASGAGTYTVVMGGQEPGPPPLAEVPRMHAAAAQPRLQLPSLEACKVMLAELLWEGHPPEMLL